MKKSPFRLLSAHHHISVAVVVELVVACIRQMDPKASACAVEYLDGSVDPHLRLFFTFFTSIKKLTWVSLNRSQSTWR